MNRYQAMNGSAGEGRQYDIINQEDEKMNGTGRAVTAGQQRAYLRLVVRICQAFCYRGIVTERPESQSSPGFKC